MPIHCKVATLKCFCKICNKCILYGRYCLTPQTPGIHHFLVCLICAKNNREVAKSGYKNVYFTINSLLKMLPHHFWCFHCLNFKKTFDKKKLKKTTIFLTSFKFLLCHKILRSDYRWQLNDYQRYPLNNS